MTLPVSASPATPLELILTGDFYARRKSHLSHRELRACARVSYRYDVGNAIRSLARLVDSCKLFLDFRLLSAFDSF